MAAIRMQAAALLGHATAPEEPWVLFARSAEGCRITDADGRTYVDLTSGEGRSVLGFGHAGVARAEREAIERSLVAADWHADAVTLARRLLDLVPGAERIRLTASGGEALTIAASLARAHTGRDRVVDFRGCAEPAALEGAAAAVVEAVDQSEFARRCACCRVAGALVIADARFAALRLSPPVAPRADLVCFGESLANGRSVGAIVGRSPLLDRSDAPSLPNFGGDPVALAAALACLDAIERERPAERAAAAGERLRTRFAEAAARESAGARLVGPPAIMDLEFDPREGVEGDVQVAAFVAELRRRGVLAGPRWMPSPMLDDAAMETFTEALPPAFRRVHAVVVERNAHVSGGLAYPFATTSPLVRARGLASYRYPTRGPARVRVTAGGVAVEIAPGPLGDVTSAGFFVPTRVHGDFVATIDYRLGRFEPGVSDACIALFAHDELSTVRYYAQRNASAAAPNDDRAYGNASGKLSPPLSVRGMEGAFRLERRGGLVRFAHRSDGRWDDLGPAVAAEARDLVIGAKLWGVGESGGLDVEFVDLRLDGTFPPEQMPLVPPRPDPLDEPSR
ncbi:MAG: aminotransferase class III-fold pyridoxal phosphate-dependent enzyme [Planctomycetes bacterium]|nr:aminotransferase class III-fold pyridoxal phosphate-dependent enzyme [Planctomycetota bacterium]